MNFLKVTPSFATKLNSNLKMVYCSSPNFSNKTAINKEIKYIVLHNTETTKEQDHKMLALDLLTNPKAQNPVSAHYLILRRHEWIRVVNTINDSDIDWHGVVNLVNDEKKAWHAGNSQWGDDISLNTFSIGIEINNDGITEKFSDFQMKALIKLLSELIKAYNISPFNIISHHEIAPQRKVDPSQHFSWQLLAKHNITYFPKSRGNNEILCKIGDINDIVEQMKHKLFSWGYRYFQLNNVFDHHIISIVESFQRRYAAYEYNNPQLKGLWTNNCDTIITELLKVRKL